MTGGNAGAFGVNSPPFPPGKANVGPFSGGEADRGPEDGFGASAFSGGGGGKSHGRGTSAAGITLRRAGAFS